MGALFSKLRRKRKLESDDSNSPKAKRVKLSSASGSSASIGYGILFQQGRDSDIEVVLLNKTWKLHKSFIQQSPYFLKLLGENSTVNKLRCSVSDPNIDCKSLELCFGFLYGGPLDFIQDSNVENILATASFLEMVDIVDRVAMYLIRNSNIENAVRYFYLAEKYDLEDVCGHIYQRLLLNLIPLFKSLLDSNPVKLNAFLSEIKMDLLKKLLKDPDLVVVKDEYDVYLLMKTWMTAVTAGTTLDTPECKSSDKSDETDKQTLATENGLSFLESARGKEFVSLFEILNLPNLFVVSRYYDILKRDRVVPSSLLDKGLDDSWKTHVTYYDDSQTTPDVDRNITPLQRVRIIRREKNFTSFPDDSASPYRLFKRFTVPLSSTDVATTTLNGFVFVVTMTPDNTLEMTVKVKPDVPHILIPTLLYTIFDMGSIWSDNSSPPSCSNPSLPSHSGTNNGPIGPNTSAAQILQRYSASDDDFRSDYQWRSGVFMGSDLMFLLPYPPSGLSRVLYDLPSGYYERVRDNPGQKGGNPGQNGQDGANDVPWLHAFVTVKMVPYFELKAAKLL
ncbi:hypothetical protein M8J75_001246 [Diaphorina citri]|nr:hypothetical protein M8J75_001246 [Diaphorina citri]